MGGGEGSADKTIINRIMLRFRPIAPKPAAGGQVAEEPGRNVLVGVARKKRRYVRVSSSTTTNSKRSSGKRSSRSERISSSCGGRSDQDDLKTLRLLPDESAHDGKEEDAPPKERDLEPSDLTMDDEIRRPRSTEAAAESSRVTVLSLTNACMGGGEAPRTDEERWRNLEGDTCPGFISDGYNNHVVWSNAAYRNMVGGEGGVALAVGEGIRLPVTCPAFSCMVKLQYTWQEEAKRIDKTAVVPCDVWRMNSGGFAWRLDPKAGLSLSLGL